MGDDTSGETVRVKAKDLTGRTAHVTVRSDSSVDEVRAAVAHALGQTGCRARLLCASVGEIAGTAPFRDTTAASQPDTVFTVVGYTRLKKRVAKDGKTKNKSMGDDFKVAERKPPASPGHRLRNYINETEDYHDMLGYYTASNSNDPLAAPVGGHARVASMRALDRVSRRSDVLKNSDADVPFATNCSIEISRSIDLTTENEKHACNLMFAELRAEAEGVVYTEVTDQDRQQDRVEKRNSKPKPKPKRKTKKPKTKKPAANTHGPDNNCDTLDPETERYSGLPTSLETLAMAYDATSKIVSFLKQQRVRSTWSQIESTLKNLGGTTLDDLRQISKLCPSALTLKQRVVEISVDNTGEEYEMPEEDEAETFTESALAKDTLVELFDVEASMKGDAEDETFGGNLEASIGDTLNTHTPRSPAQRAVVHGSRTSRATYDVGGADAVGDGSRNVPDTTNRVAGEAFAKRASTSFRSFLSRLVIAEVDSAMDDEGFDSEQAWATIFSAPVSVFIERSKTIETVKGKEKPEGENLQHTDKINFGDKKRKTLAGARSVCTRCDSLDVEGFIKHLTVEDGSLGGRGMRDDGIKNGTKSYSCVEHRRDEPARPAKYCAAVFNRNLLSKFTVSALKVTGVDNQKLFSHQSTAIQSVLSGTNTVVATGTASGKSVCYNAPTFEFLGKDPNATALFLFPTKALARDQVGKLTNMCLGAAEGALNFSGCQAAEDREGVRDEELLTQENSIHPSYHPFDVGVFDGDTDNSERERIRNDSRLIVANPDTLHVTFLPNHRHKYSNFFAGLKIVVLDEAHVYRGVFGSHVSCVIRRLRRVCREVYGTDPVFVVTSATISDPLTHAKDLCGDFGRLKGVGHDSRGIDPFINTWTSVTQDGSPRGAKTFLMWNPPAKETVLNSKKRKATEEKGKAAISAKLKSGQEISNSHRQTGTRQSQTVKKQQQTVTTQSQAVLNESRRASPIVEMAHLLVECVRHNLRVIAFCKTKKLCELVLRYSRELLVNNKGEHLLESIAAYRGGYTSADRRATENNLFSGNLKAVCATNALELGVDVGVLDATLHLGFPGSCASLTQQFGRAGRRGKRALGIYVAFDGPLDQYFMHHPDRLWDGSITERAAVDFSNSVILGKHVECAARESPIDPRVEGKDATTYFISRDGSCNAFRTAVDHSVRSMTIARDPESIGSKGDLRLRWVGAKTPASLFGIRTIEGESYEIRDIDSGNTIETVEASKAFWSVHPGAVYLNQARTFLVKKLDVAKKTAFVRRADVKYFTSSLDSTTLELLDHAGSKAVYPDRPMGVHQAEYGLPVESIASQSNQSHTSNNNTSAQVAECSVTITFTGFRKIYQSTGAAFDEVSFQKDLHVTLPAVEFKTVACWLRVPETARALCKTAGVSIDDASHAASHVLINALPLLLLVNHADVACECFASGTQYAPRRLLLYDKHPGGVGIAKRVAPLFLELMRRSLELVCACDCGVKDNNTEIISSLLDSEIEDVEICELKPNVNQSGCPACTHYTKCDHYNDGLDKRGAIVVLRETIRVEEARLEGLKGGVVAMDATREENEACVVVDAEGDGVARFCCAQGSACRKRGKCVSS